MGFIDIHKIVNCGRENYKAMESETNSIDRSWEHCHGKFQHYRGTVLSADDVDILCLSLGWYLASWGMLRNSFLNKYSHKIHEEAIAVLLDEKWDSLWDIDYSQLTEEQAKDIIRLSRELSETYRAYLKDASKDLTDTLKTKILLGTLACVPAYDRFFVSALKCTGIAESSFNERSVKKLAQMYKTYMSAFEELRFQDHEGKPYPSAKCIDMCLFTYGTDVEKTKDAMNKEFPDDFKGNKKEDRGKRTFMCLYAIHGQDVLRNAEYKNIYNKDAAFFDAVLLKIRKQ